MGSLRRPSRGSALPGSPPKLTGFPGCLLSALPAGLSWGRTSLLSETGCVISFFSFERPPTLVISSSSSCRRKLLINVLKELVPGFVTWMRRLLSSSSANTTPPLLIRGHCEERPGPVSRRLPVRKCVTLEKLPFFPLLLYSWKMSLPPLFLDPPVLDGPIQLRFSPICLSQPLTLPPHVLLTSLSVVPWRRPVLALL